MNSRKFVATAALMSAALAAGTPAQAGFSPFIGEIIPYAMNFCPSGWVPADGRLLPISEYNALFALYGTIYGGDGQTTFAVPDLRGRAAVGDGTGTGIGTFFLGQRSGTEQFSITTNAMPAHTHVATLSAVPTNGTTNVPTGNSLARDDAEPNRIYSTAAPANNMNAGDVVIGVTGSGTPVTLTAPALAMSYCVALEGLFPSRP